MFYYKEKEEISFLNPTDVKGNEYQYSSSPVGCGVKSANQAYRLGFD